MVAINASQPVKLSIQNKFMELWTAAGKPRVIKSIVNELAEGFNVDKWLVYSITRELRPHRSHVEFGNDFSLARRVPESHQLWEVKVKEATLIVSAENLMEAVTQPINRATTVVQCGEVISVSRIEKDESETTAPRD